MPKAARKIDEFKGCPVKDGKRFGWKMQGDWQGRAAIIELTRRDMMAIILPFRKGTKG